MLGGIMNKTKIRQAQANDKPIIESILLDAVKWLNEMEQSLWRAEDVKWDALSKAYKIEDFYIAFSNDG
jgi:DNA-directed RNA polymerase specialized sigma24 family protein